MWPAFGRLSCCRWRISTATPTASGGKRGEKVKAENDWTSAQVSPYQDRLRAFCSINPLKDYALDEIARCGKDAQLRRGLKLHFGNSDVISQTALYLARLKQVFALANRQGMAIVVHMRASVTMKRDYGASRGRAQARGCPAGGPGRAGADRAPSGAGGYNDPGADEVMGVFVEAIASDPRVRRLYFDVSGVAGLGNWRPRAAAIAARLGRHRTCCMDRRRRRPEPDTRAGWAAFRELPLTEEEFRTIAENVAQYMK